MTLSKEEIGRALEGAEYKTKTVPVPELGGSVVVREMSGTLRNMFEATMAQIMQPGADAKPLDKLMVRLAKECILDGDGSPLLDDRTSRLLFAKKSTALFRLRDEIVRLSAFSEEDAESLVESFGDDPSELSTSG